MSKYTAIYVRVSTADQHCENQLPDLTRWARANDVAIPPDDEWLRRLEIWKGSGVAWYPEKATGQTQKRPAWKKLKAEFEAGRVDRVVCWRLDRLGRRATGLNYFFDQCIELGANLISLKEGVDLSTLSGRMIAGVLASIAQFECESMKARQRAKIEVDRDRQAKAHDLKEEGLSAEEISRRLCIAPTRTHSPAQIVERILAKPRGTLWYGGRKNGDGRNEDCSNDRVRVLLSRGLRIDEVAAATGTSRRTVYRRLKEIQVEAVDNAVMQVGVRR